MAGGAHANHEIDDTEHLPEALDDIDERLRALEALVEPPEPIPPPTDLKRHTTYEPGEERQEAPQTATAHGLTITSETSRSGAQAGVALLKPEDPQWKGNKGYRAEWHGVDWVPLGVERWHGFSFCLPEDWHQGDRRASWKNRIIFQFHTSGGPGFSPIYGLEVVEIDGRPWWKFYRKRTPRGPNDPLWVEQAVVGHWTDFAINVIWSNDDDGKIHFYRGQQHVYGRDGLMTMNDEDANQGPYSKWGIYGQPTRILFDEVRIAEGPDQLAAVSP